MSNELRTVMYISAAIVVSGLVFKVFKAFWMWHFPVKKIEKKAFCVMCDGCGNNYSYPIHTHFGYNSCSKECDEFLDEIFEEQNL